jgi:hypothetical protein
MPPRVINFVHHLLGTCWTPVGAALYENEGSFVYSTTHFMFPADA